MNKSLNEQFRDYIVATEDGTVKLDTSVPQTFLNCMKQIDLSECVLSIQDSHKETMYEGQCVYRTYKVTFIDGGKLITVVGDQDGDFWFTLPDTSLQNESSQTMSDLFDYSFTNAADFLGKWLYNLAEWIIGPASRVYSDNLEAVDYDVPIQTDGNMYIYCKEISVAAHEVQQAKEILAAECGLHPEYNEDDTIQMYSTSFVTPFGEYGIDIKLCNGDTPYVEPVLYDVTPDRAMVQRKILDTKTTLLCEYEFDIAEGDNILIFRVKLLSGDLASSGAQTKSKYAIDLDMVRLRLEELQAIGNEKALAKFACEVIPLLIEDSKITRMEVVNGLLNR